MKTALCLYGQPRDAHNKFSEIYKNIIEPNDCDVFFHAWYDPAKPSINKLTPGHEHRTISYGMDHFLVQNYKPRKYRVDSQKKFFHRNFSASEQNIEACWPYSKKYDKETFIKHKSEAIHSMWYSIMNTVMLKEEFSHENNFTYDAVFLSRFDVSSTNPILVKDYDLSKVITRNYVYPRGEVSDWLLLSSNSNINVIGSIFLFLDQHYKKIKNSNLDIWTNEAFIREQLKLLNIETLMGNFDVTF